METKKKKTAAESWIFFTKFIKNPLRNASIIPSSKASSRAMLEGIDFDAVDVVVELGPGNGVFTHQLLSRVKPGTKIILIELDTTFIQLLQKKFGNRVEIVNSGAHLMDQILIKRGITKVDLIISGLPFLKGEVKETLDNSIVEHTKSGTIYRFFTYMPPIMKKVYKSMPIQKKVLEVKNIPPLWVYGIN